jgi:hypothetical protein
VARAASGGTERIITSADGTNWTLVTAANTKLQEWTGVCWSTELGLFVAVARAGAFGRVVTSPNGVTWTDRTNSVDSQCQEICWAPQLRRLCAVSDNLNSVMTSDATFNVAFTDSYTKATSMTVGTGGVNITNAGTVSAPSLYLSTDTGSGLYRPAANQVAVAVSGVQAMNITSTGTTVAGLQVGTNGTSSSEIRYGSSTVGALSAGAGTTVTLTFTPSFSTTPTLYGSVQSTTAINSHNAISISFGGASASGATLYASNFTAFGTTGTATISWFART